MNARNRKPIISPKESSTIKSKTKEKEFNCQECYFQGTKQMELNKHINKVRLKDQ